MTPSTFLILAIHEALALALFSIALFRSAHASDKTSRAIHVSLKIVGASSIAAVAAPLYGWRPDIVTMLLLIALVTALAVERRMQRRQ